MVLLSRSTTIRVFIQRFSTPAIIYGNTEFVGGITFSGEYITFNGGTVDLQAPRFMEMLYEQ